MVFFLFSHICRCTTSLQRVRCVRIWCIYLKEMMEQRTRKKTFTGKVYNILVMELHFSQFIKKLMYYDSIYIQMECHILVGTIL